jgi:DNA repair protein RadA/Sms
MRVNEPAADLAVSLAITSSYKEIPCRSDMAVFGEVGLSGELRPVPQMAARVREAVKLGFGKVMIPKHPEKGEPIPHKDKLIIVGSLQEAVSKALPIND